MNCVIMCTVGTVEIRFRANAGRGCEIQALPRVKSTLGIVALCVRDTNSHVDADAVKVIVRYAVNV